MTPLGQHIFVTGFRNGFNLMEERTPFEETEVLAISPDARVAFKVGDTVVVRKSGIIRDKGTIIVPLSDCVLWKPGPFSDEILSQKFEGEENVRYIPNKK